MCEEPRVSMEPQDKQLYLGHCASCHGKKIDQPLGSASNLYYSGLTPHEMEEVTREGIYGTDMKSYDKLLSEDEIKLIVKYIDDHRIN
jgi:mono/diheme cytochrome c family protein